jgi:uncharacterized alkaline shock family protein YloU
MRSEQAEMSNWDAEYQSTDLGKIEIAPEVIQIIAGLAVVQVDGVAGMSGGVVDDISQFLGRKNPRQGIRVEFEEGLSIEVSILVKFGSYIPDVGKAVQEQVKHAVETMTGLQVEKVNVRVEGVKFPEKPTAAEATQRVK